MPINACFSGDYTLVICPGIGNSSETLYIRTMVDYCQNSGFRVVVQNHLGSLKDVKLTSPRIFTYGKIALDSCQQLEVQVSFRTLQDLLCSVQKFLDRIM